MRVSVLETHKLSVLWRHYTANSNTELIDNYMQNVLCNNCDYNNHICIYAIYIYINIYNYIYIYIYNIYIIYNYIYYSIATSYH